MTEPDEPTLFDPAPVDPPAAAADLGPLVRVRLLVAYHGGPFHGFAANPGVRTVGGDLSAAIAQVVGHPVELTVAGRTDKGVHAWGNVVSFDVNADRLAPGQLDLDTLQRALNRMLQPHIVVREAATVPDGFSARFWARSRTYRYLVCNRPIPDPFLADRAWWVEAPLDLALLRLACDPFLGTHDFAAFCRRPKRSDGHEADLRRHVMRAGWEDLGDGVLRFEIQANAFCHQMVRSVVGTIVDAGAGRLTAGEISSLIRAGDRQATGGRLAPPQGLILWQVELGDGPRLPIAEESP